MLVMAGKKKVPPSRQGVGYVYLPKEEYEALKKRAAEDDRSASYLVKIAVREYLAKFGMWPPPRTEGGSS